MSKVITLVCQYCLLETQFCKKFSFHVSPAEEMPKMSNVPDSYSALTLHKTRKYFKKKSKFIFIEI